MADEKPVFLYQQEPKVYPRRADGRYARLRIVAMLLLLGFYYAVPWIQISGTPLVWFDLPHRRFHVFTLTLAPQDLIYLTWLLLIAALTLFFFTALGGRLWCGYACPQTVWTEAFLWMEHFTEGDRHARMKLDRAPWGAEKIVRKGSKHLLWLLFALFTGLTFVAYFIPARQLFPQAIAGDLGGWPLFWTLFYGFATWGNAGFLREQVCKYMCPYARFQSVMFDKDTLIIAYDERRGEPRKSVAKQLGVSPASCVDCSLCVQVCPTGIDIRKGLQHECIACAACIDVCNDVMDAVAQPRGLIRYTSAHRDEGRGFKLLRPRTLAYGLIWAGLCAGFVVALMLRMPLEFDVIRDRHALYRELGGGEIENLYTLKLANQDSNGHSFVLRVQSEDGATYRLEPERLTLAAGESRSLTLSVRRAGGGAGGIHPLTLELAADDGSGLHRQRKTSFITGETHAP